MCVCVEVGIIIRNEFCRYGMTSQPDLRIKFRLQSTPSIATPNGTPTEASPTSSHNTNTTESPACIEFLLLACDGLWERYSEGAAVAFVRNRLLAGSSWCDGLEHRYVKWCDVVRTYWVI